MSKTVMVSGGFDPVHVGHLRMFQAAKELGDKLIVVINNDNWLELKKGKHFMPEEDRREIIEGFGCVDQAILTKHQSGTTDMSVCDALREVHPDIFANGGDRFADNIPEKIVCDELNIEAVFNVGGGKVASSSDLANNYGTK